MDAYLVKRPEMSSDAGREEYFRRLALSRDPKQLLSLRRKGEAGFLTSSAEVVGRGRP